MRRLLLSAATVLLIAALLMIPTLRQPEAVSFHLTDGNTAEEHEPGELPEEPAAISVIVSMKPDEFEDLQESNKRFMERFPYLTVTITNDSSPNAADAWMEEAELGSGADIMLLDSRSVKHFAVRGLLRPAGRSGNAEPTDERPPGLLDPLKWNGYTWGTPKDADPYVLVWSRSKLSELGRSDPPGDWASYRSVAAEIAQRGAGVPFLYLSAGQAEQSAAWLDAFADYSLAPAYLSLKSEIAQEKLGWLHANMPLLRLQGLEDDDARAEAVVQGRLLSAFIPWSVYTSLSSADRSELALASVPIRPAWMNARSYAVSAKASSPEEAMRWIQEMTGTAEQRRTFERFGKLPAAQSLYAGQGAGGQSPPAWLLEDLEKGVLNESDAQNEAGGFEQWEREWSKLASSF